MACEYHTKSQQRHERKDTRKKRLREFVWVGVTPPPSGASRRRLRIPPRFGRPRRRRCRARGPSLAHFSWSKNKRYAEGAAAARSPFSLPRQPTQTPEEPYFLAKIPWNNLQPGKPRETPGSLTQNPANRRSSIPYCERKASRPPPFVEKSSCAPPMGRIEPNRTEKHPSRLLLTCPFPII